MVGGCGAGRFGTKLAAVGGFGGARLGTRLPNGGDIAWATAGEVRGIGGGARGFSKLPSWF